MQLETGDIFVPFLIFFPKRDKEIGERFKKINIRFKIKHFPDCGLKAV